MSPGYRVAKRVLDVVGAAGALIVLSPVLAVGVAAVWVGMGRPIFFRQTRAGRGGRPFVLFKLRTMLDRRDAAGALLPDAQRLTRVGTWLRGSSIDELPQLVNVLRGEMSLVGPRPLPMEYVPRYTPDEAERLRVKPGITGWTQVNGRNLLDWSQRLAFDRFYVANAGLLLDLRILLRTVGVVLRRVGIRQEGHVTSEPFLGTLALAPRLELHLASSRLSQPRPGAPPRHETRPQPHAEAGAWLPQGKHAAVCLHVDDIHPARGADGYDAGGDMGAGALGHLEWLLERHPELRVTLFTTPDWRELSPVPTRRLLARVPGLRDRVYLAPIRRRGSMRLDRHPEFVRYLNGLPRTEVALHGLHHVHRGLSIPAEFQEQGVDECMAMLRESLEIFRAAGLPEPRGMCPPLFSTPPALVEAMAEVGMDYVASTRDILTPAAPGAVSAMAGLRGMPLLHPAVLPGGLVNVPTNFQATSPRERALQIVEGGGLLSIKAHVVKEAFGVVALDGLDRLYRNYLDSLFTLLRDRFGDALWWPTVAEVADAVRAAEQRDAQSAGAA